MNNAVSYTDMKDSGIKWIGSVPASWNVRTLYQLATRVNNKNSDLSEQNLLSLSYGKIKRKDINTNDGLLPASFDGYNIIEAGDILLPPEDEQICIVEYLDGKCDLIDSIVAEKEALIAELEVYKRSLIYETVTGKRKVV